MNTPIPNNQDLSTISVLVTGGCGFIGSHLVEHLLTQKAKVRVLDNLSTGRRSNVEGFINNPNFELLEGDIRDFELCKNACNGMEYVLHQAALGSVPRSIQDPLASNDVNVTGFLNILEAARTSAVKRVVYAASSSTYGDNSALPKREDVIGKPLSPYAVTKLVNELYADVYAKTYGMKIIGLRYFNVFGPRQNPEGPYAAVLPLFIQAALSKTPPQIHGDGLQTRDFTYIDNVVQANLKAMLAIDHQAVNQVYNVACGERHSLIDIWNYIQDILQINIQAMHEAARQGDVRNSLADISKAEKLLGYKADIKLKEGLKKTIQWYQSQE